MRSECGAGSFTITGNDVDDTFRESRFLDQLREFHRADRSLLGRFENDCVTCRECWGEFPCGHQEWEVPGNDLATDANRLAQGVVEHLAGHGNGFAFDLRGPTCEVLEVLDYLRQIDVKRLFDRLAVVGRFEGGEISRVLLD